LDAKRTHILIGTPCYGGQITSFFATSLLKLQQVCQKTGDIDLTVLMLSGDALITRARQNLVAHFLENPTATHLLFIDADIGFEPEQVFRLLRFGAEMTAAPYPVKKIDWKKVAKSTEKGQTPLDSAALSYVFGFEDPDKIQVKNGFAKVRSAGTGFLLIARSALLKMTERYPELKYKREDHAEDPLTGSSWRFALFNCLIDEATGTYLSEDFSFCRRWTDMGGEIWVDLESKLTHTGSFTFNGITSTQFEMPTDGYTRLSR
jgi:hypothetical protein